MVLGQTGCGKTTLLNALSNYHMGVEFRDSFRYMLIKEEFKHRTDETKSQTVDVIEYHLKPRGSYPPLIVIDVPGFGDTGGVKKDLEII
jgi:septin family protein